MDIPILTNVRAELINRLQALGVDPSTNPGIERLCEVAIEIKQEHGDYKVVFHEAEGHNETVTIEVGEEMIYEGQSDRVKPIMQTSVQWIVDKTAWVELIPESPEKIESERRQRLDKLRWLYMAQGGTESSLGQDAPVLLTLEFLIESLQERLDDIRVKVEGIQAKLEPPEKPSSNSGCTLLLFAFGVVSVLGLGVIVQTIVMATR